VAVSRPTSSVSTAPLETRAVRYPETTKPPFWLLEGGFVVFTRLLIWLALRTSIKNYLFWAL
jgi:hypothetical protein